MFDKTKRGKVSIFSLFMTTDFRSVNFILALYCIHWVKFEKLDDLENSLDRDMFQTFGKPPRMNKH